MERHMSDTSFVMPPKAAIAEKYRAAMDRIWSAHVKPFPGHPEPCS